MRSLGSALLLALLLVAAALAQEPAPHDMSASVVQVVATTSAGRTLLGSAVVIDRGKLITNCHVLRDAREVHVARGAQKWRAERRAADGRKDLCVLAAPGLDAPAARLVSTATLKVGDTAHAIGYGKGGSLGVTEGRIESLYDFEGARVIRTSASFDVGASGGALFTASGLLAGILTFKAPSGGSFHFAIPVDWLPAVEAAGQSGPAGDSGPAFFEGDSGHWAHFLRAVWYESTQQWSTLVAVCEHWASNEPGSEEARLTMTRAVDRLRRSTPGMPRKAP
jgi:S1-C subfamily serine protease